MTGRFARRWSMLFAVAIIHATATRGREDVGGECPVLSSIQGHGHEIWHSVPQAFPTWSLLDLQRNLSSGNKALPFDKLLSFPMRCGLGNARTSLLQRIPAPATKGDLGAAGSAGTDDISLFADPIFIAGAGHSGTTLLRAILGRHPDIWSWNISESELHRWAVDKPGKVINPIESSLFVRHGNDDAALAKALSYWETRAAAVSESRSSGPRSRRMLRILEKTPSHICHIGQILRLRPASKIVLIVRDGRAVIPSLARRYAEGQKTSDNSYIRALVRWVDDNRAGLSHARVDSRIVVVRFEDLVGVRRRDVLRRLLERLQLDTMAEPDALLDRMLLANGRHARRRLDSEVPAAGFVGHGRFQGRRERLIAAHIAKREAQTQAGVGVLDKSRVTWQELEPFARGLILNSVAYSLLRALCYVPELQQVEGSGDEGEAGEHAVEVAPSGAQIASLMHKFECALASGKERCVTGGSASITTVWREPRGRLQLAQARVVRRCEIISNDTLQRDAPALLSEDLMRGGVSMTESSVIKRPQWLRPSRSESGLPARKYLLYFANHNGKTLRVATSDRADAGWRVHDKGVLNLEVDAACEKHVGSPDVHVDHLEKRIILYFHGSRCPGDGDKAAAAGRADPVVQWDAEFTANQRTYVAWSADGVHFTPVPSDVAGGTRRSPWEIVPDRRSTADTDSDSFSGGGSVPALGTTPLAAPYLRVFWWRGVCFGIGMPSLLYRSNDPWCAGGFELGPQLPGLGGKNTRHHAVRVRPEAGVLEILFTRVGDRPERVLCVEVLLGHPDNWREWAPNGEAVVVLQSEGSYEGAGAPPTSSVRGQAGALVQQLRNPFILDEDGNGGGSAARAWLFYSTGGGQSIGVAELAWGNEEVEKRKN